MNFCVLGSVPLTSMLFKGQLYITSFENILQTSGTLKLAQALEQVTNLITG